MEKWDNINNMILQASELINPMTKEEIIKEAGKVITNLKAELSLLKETISKQREEIERLKVATVDDATIKAIQKMPGLVPKICANEIRKNEELSATIKSQSEEIERLKDQLAGMPKVGSMDAQDTIRQQREALAKCKEFIDSTEWCLTDWQYQEPADFSRLQELKDEALTLLDQIEKG